MSRRFQRGAVVLLAAVGLYSSALGTAHGQVSHDKESTFPLSGLSFLAVDNSAGPSAGKLYVGEVDSETFVSRIYQTDAAGTPTGLELDGSETPAGFFGLINFATFRLGDGPAVDPTSGPNAGRVYVPDIANGVVDLFNEAGEYVCQITGNATPSASECAGPTGSETPIGGMEPLSVAVDPSSGNIAVGDGSGVVFVFNDAGEYESQISDPSTAFPASIAFDSTGSLYVVNGSLFAGAGEAAKFDPAGSFAYTLSSGRVSVGVDLGNDHVYLGGEGDTEEFDATGAAVSSFGSGNPEIQALSLDVNEITSQVYLAVLFGEGEIWSGPIFVPNVSTGEATDVADTTATLHGSVDPEAALGGSAVEACEFEYGEDESYGQTTPCLPPTPYASATEVSASLAGLSQSTTYHYRLVAENADGNRGLGEDETFTTSGPPSVSDEKAIARTTSATVHASINPFGYGTTCEVEYVTEASFQASGFVGAANAPCGDSLAAGFDEEPATATLTDLQIATAYRYRFVVTNEAGTTVGQTASFSTFGIDSFSLEVLDDEGLPYVQAGGVPYELRVTLDLSTTEPVSDRNPKSVAANVRTVRVDLPPGLIGNPMAASVCKSYEMTRAECPPSAQIGTSKVFAPRDADASAPVYNLVPPVGVAAQLGARFNSFGTVRIDAGIRTGADYGITSNSVFISADEGVERVEMTLWGVPADESHDSDRKCPNPPIQCSGGLLRPFLTNPTACLGPLSSMLSVDTWQDPGNFVSATSGMPAIMGCDKLDFDPTISVQPETRTSESPTGLNVDLHLPQNQNPGGLAEAHLKDAVVTLPEGLAINPAGATGLAACSRSQIQLRGPDPAACPDASKIGTVAVDTPLLDHPLPGAIYVATPHDNPFGSLLAIYIAVHDPKSGVVVKLAGEVSPDSQTGQLTTTFKENPQLPFEDFTLNFFGGPGAALVTPETCGAYATTTDLRPWSENGDKHPQSSFGIDSGPNGSPCAGTLAEKPNQQGFTAGTINPVAGDDTPFVLKLSREDGSQRLSRIDTVLPPGLVGKLAGVAYCPEAALAAAAGRQGAAEQASPSCPAVSRVGTVNAGAGAGPRPYFTQGTAYLAGPYKGAPISLAVITPAVAGPFDLGNPVVRVALHVDPVTARITAQSDPLPQILQGIPLNLRSINVRTDITRNPTSCAPMSVGGTAFSVLNQAASLSDRFQVGDCASLGFKPRLFMRLFGGTKRGAHPRLRAVLMPRAGHANIGRAVVTMPPSAFLDQSNIRTICTRVQWARDNCPKAARYGRAVAHSPLLDQPLRGPVYLRSSNNKLPDLVADLRGPAHQPIRVELVGRIDSKRGGIRTTFASVPDAPVSKFILHMKGGKRQGLIVNSRDLCERTYRAAARFKGHNGRIQDLRPALRSRCPG